MWERLPDGIDKQYVTSERLEVPGGWIVRTYVTRGVAQTFVSDPHHTWQLEKSEKK